MEKYRWIYMRDIDLEKGVFASGEKYFKTIALFEDLNRAGIVRIYAFGDCASTRTENGFGEHGH